MNQKLKRVEEEKELISGDAKAACVYYVNSVRSLQAAKDDLFRNKIARVDELREFYARADWGGRQGSGIARWHPKFPEQITLFIFTVRCAGTPSLHQSWMATMQRKFWLVCLMRNSPLFLFRRGDSAKFPD